MNMPMARKCPEVSCLNNETRVTMEKTMTEAKTSIMPAPPNPIQREAMFRVAKTKVEYVYTDPKQGLLLCWNTIWKQCKEGKLTYVVVSSPELLDNFKTLIGDSGLSCLTFYSGDTPANIRSKLTQRKKQISFDPMQKLPWRNWKRRVIHRFMHEKKSLFGERPYHIIAREWFDAEQNGRADILEARTDPSLFQFTPQEFYQIRGRIKEAEAIFNPQISRDPSLSALHHRFFTEMSAEEAEEWLYDQLDDAARYTRELLQRTHKILSGYKKFIQAERFELFRNFQEEIEQVRDRIDAAHLAFGDDFFEKTSGLQGRLKQSFSSKSKEVDQQRKHIKLAYMELHRSMESSVFGPYIEAFEDLSMNSIRALLDKQEKKLEESWLTVLQMAQEGQIRLNSRNMEGNEDQIMVIRRLENDIEEWFRKLNEWKIFKKPMEENALSLPKKGEILGHILELLDDTTTHLPRFIPYHQWRSFTIHLSEPIRQIIDLLGEERNPDWVASFECWYFSQLLAIHQQPSTLFRDFDNIPQMWQDKRHAELGEWLENYSKIDPDGGWLTRLNEMAESDPTDHSESAEIDRLFPIQVYRNCEELPQQGDHMRILVENRNSPRITAEDFHLVITDRQSNNTTKERHRLFDPRLSWQDPKDVLNVKHADKIRGIRPFAEALIFEIGPARLFQSKDLLIVSRWPALIEETLEQKLGKNMKVEELNLEEDAVPLMEGLLNNERGMYLLVEEGFLNMDDPVWESIVIGWCESAGLNVISLNWRDAWRNENTWLDQIIEVLNSPKAPERT